MPPSTGTDVGRSSTVKQIQILLPVADETGDRFPERIYADLRATLTAKFGGVTIFAQAPAEGLWVSDGAVCRDDIVIFEVMTDRVDRAWWSWLRADLERAMRQHEIVVRVQEIERL